MSLRRSYIEDVLEVLHEIQNTPSWKKKDHHISSTRKKAVQKVAMRELDQGRFTNFNSADRSIHDACTRRLNVNTNEFDTAIGQWQLGRPESLNSILSQGSNTTSQ